MYVPVVLLRATRGPLKASRRSGTASRCTYLMGEDIETSTGRQQMIDLRPDAEGMELL